MDSGSDEHTYDDISSRESIRFVSTTENSSSPTYDEAEVLLLLCTVITIIHCIRCFLIEMKVSDSPPPLPPAERGAQAYQNDYDYAQGNIQSCPQRLALELSRLIGNAQNALIDMAMNPGTTVETIIKQMDSLNRQIRERIRNKKRSKNTSLYVLTLKKNINKSNHVKSYA